MKQGEYFIVYNHMEENAQESGDLQEFREDIQDTIKNLLEDNKEETTLKELIEKLKKDWY